MDKERKYEMNGACIITYNPDIIRLKENIQAIVPQVDGIVVEFSSERVSTLTYFKKRSVNPGYLDTKITP